jgi:hypothetical protein
MKNFERQRLVAEPGLGDYSAGDMPLSSSRRFFIAKSTILEGVSLK